jgi:hypothetical protein
MHSEGSPKPWGEGLTSARCRPRTMGDQGGTAVGAPPKKGVKLLS